ncbi:hypothetical protein BISA_2221 [Bifidobacterium saguini DSM 23967]|uniref:Integral membrane protein n=2 Tax=Bifidobacterium saguini TaxID=762210 RepID=A0A087D5P9_9BIFI|nr:hypothetical protein [Bifidobacterium saguini]KFI90849.1 hypothetical protein BISA_2221 [Bifidobacterium saguini DSM 23967]QTB90736.1 hypothetical protein BSD967_10675 [Bifidobacterium saguini]
MEPVLSTIASWASGLWTWMVHLNGMLQVVLVLLCVLASGACAVAGRRMGSPMMESVGQSAGRTAVTVALWVAGTVLMLIALLGIAAVFAPLVGLA